MPSAFSSVGLKVPLVVDADALNILAGGRVLAGVRRDDWVLTPHPGEMARLLDCSAEEVQADRLEAVRRCADRHGATVVLKGHRSLVADGYIAFIDFDIWISIRTAFLV